MSDYIIMVKLTENKLTKNELRLIAKNRGIKNYQNISKEKLSSTLDKLKRITKIYQKMGLIKS